MIASPSTAWRERIEADEAQRHAAAAAQLVALQRGHSARLGQGRALHRKQLMALHALLRVHADLPPWARHGLFERPLTYEAWVRLSNGGPDRRSDRRPDVRGFALRIFGVQGEGALGGVVTHQDITLINHPAFAFADSRHFAGLVVAAARGPVALLPWALRSFGPLGALGQLPRLARMFARPFSGFATEPFFSAAPLACGPYAMRLRLLPPDGEKAAQGVGWRDDLATRLQHGALVYRLQGQFFTDETTTPIEDASVDWPEDRAPYLTLADLVLPQQDAAVDADFEREVESSIFDPWQALATHRPLGEVMRARKVSYFESQKARGAA